MGLNPGYLLKSYLFYHNYWVVPSQQEPTKQQLKLHPTSWQYPLINYLRLNSSYFLQQFSIDRRSGHVYHVFWKGTRVTLGIWPASASKKCTFFSSFSENNKQTWSKDTYIRFVITLFHLSKVFLYLLSCSILQIIILTDGTTTICAHLAFKKS